MCSCGWYRKVFLKVTSGIFLLFTKIKPLQNDENWFLFYAESFFHSQDINLFVFSYSPHFLLWANAGIVEWRWLSNIMTSQDASTEFYKHMLMDILRSIWHLMMIIGPIVEYCIKNFLNKKICSKCVSQTSSRPLFKLGKWWKSANLISRPFKSNLFWKRIFQNIWKTQFNISLWTQSLFIGNIKKKQRGQALMPMSSWNPNIYLKIFFVQRSIIWPNLVV